jgi:putative ABC transport system permease protein
MLARLTRRYSCWFITKIQNEEKDAQLRLSREVMESLLQDLRFGLRVLIQQPGFTTIAVLTLALGIGANTAIFTVINGVLLRPLPFDEPERLVMLWESNPRKNIDQQRPSQPNLVEWKAQSSSFENIGYWSGAGEYNLAASDGTEKVRGAYVESNLFPTLRVQPQIGRTFARDDDIEKGNRVAIISHDHWQRRYAADPQVLGRSLTVDTFGRVEYTIIGVMPHGFSFPDKTEIWLPAGWNGLPRNRREGHWLSTIARLKSTASLDQARSELNTIQNRIAADNPKDFIGSNVAVVPLLEQTLGSNLRAALLILWGVVACVLLISCANVANLLLARAADRQKELAIRLALGVDRLRIVRQLVAESLILAIAGGTVGILLAKWTLNLLIAFNADHVPRLSEARLDWTSLGFTLIVACITGVLFGLAPALQITRTDLYTTLKDAGKGGMQGRERRRMREILVVSQVALSMILLTAAALMIRSFAQLTRVDRGFQPDQLVTAGLDFSVSGFTTWLRPTETRPQVSIRELLDRLRSQPGIQEVAAASDQAGIQITFESRQSGAEEDYPRTAFQGVTPDYFRAMGISLLRGAPFSENDSFEAPRIAIISESLARRYFPNESPVGGRIYPGRLNPGQSGVPDRVTQRSQWIEITGVVTDTKSINLNPEIEPNIYVPYWQWPMQRPTLFVRTSGNPTHVASTIYGEVKALNKGLPMPRIQTMNERLSDVVAQPRFQTLLLGLFGLVTLVLVSAGIYSVVSYSVSRRTQEFGIRMALGARTRDVLSLVIWNGMKLVCVGIGLGLVGSFLLTRLLKRLLFGVSATDPIAFVLATLVLAGVVLLACSFPARRATRVDPATALRYE